MTTSSNENLKLTALVAGADLSAKQWHAVKLNSTGVVVLATADTDKAIGILINEPTSGQPCEIVALGETKAAMAATVAVGDSLTVNSTSQLKTTTTAGKKILAIALEANTTAGHRRRVLIVGQNNL